MLAKIFPLDNGDRPSFDVHEYSEHLLLHCQTAVDILTPSLQLSRRLGVLALRFNTVTFLEVAEGSIRHLLKILLSICMTLACPIVCDRV